jgi:hypothetical protein
MLLQVPSEPATLQALQVPLQAVAQQMPWAHCPDAHSPVAVHACPFTFLQTPPAQV